MEFGIAVFPTEDVQSPGELGALAEGHDFESLWFPEHTHIPTSRESPYPGGGELPEYYKRTLDPFVALTAAAATTERLLLGTGVCLVIERDPIVTAKEVASVDQLSGGRLLFGIGAGWNIEEMTNHGTDATRRFGLMRERTEAMKTIWTEEVASYSGEQVAFKNIWSWPKPAQHPHPPILIGGGGPHVEDRVIRYADGWIPNLRGGDDEMLARVEAFHAKARDAGRPGLPVSIMGYTTDPARLERYRQAGLNRYVFWLSNEDGRDGVSRTLEKAVAAVASVNG